MLVELKKLNIINDGYNRKVSLDKMYVNTDHIISITDYVNINGYLLSEEFSKKSFSLLKIGNVSSIEEIIVFGTSEEIYSSINSKKEKRILNG